MLYVCTRSFLLDVDVVPSFVASLFCEAGRQACLFPVPFVLVRLANVRLFSPLLT